MNKMCHKCGVGSILLDGEVERDQGWARFKVLG